MVSLVPVNLSVADVHAAAGLSPDTDIPDAPAAADLDNWAQENYSLDLHAATSLGFPVGSLSADSKHQALLFGSSRWRDVTAGGHTYRFGVALRAIVIVTDVQGSGGLTLPVVAAKVEIDGARATAQLLVRGYKGSALAGSLPAWQTFGVDSYHEYMKAVSDIQKLILEDDSGVEPELLATTVVSTRQPSVAASVGAVYALHAIAEGASLAHAIDKSELKDSEAVAAVRDVYQSQVGADEQARPTVEQKQSALEQLNGLHLRSHWQEFFGR